MHSIKMAEYKAEHFLWETEGTVATITINRPERKNPLTFDSYAELRDVFRDLVYAADIEAVIIRSNTQGIDKFLFPPPGFGISFLRAGFGW